VTGRVFLDRVEAGRELAGRLVHLRDQPVVVLGLPRGGVPVAAEVAAALGAPLDVIVVRKLGVPHQPELGMGAIGEDGVRIVDDRIVRMAAVSDAEVAAVEERERTELARRVRRYRGDRPRLPLAGRVAVVVDDGIATGSTALAACRVARAQGAARVVLAVPVAPPGWEQRIGTAADECVALVTPEPFWAIGQFYLDFSPTSDTDVVDCLAPPTPAPATDADPPDQNEDVDVDVGPLRLPGRLTVPAGSHGVVVFAHGSGSSRFSPRNRYVAGVLQGVGLGTLLLDLLTAAEEHDRANVFDIDLLAARLLGATDWLGGQARVSGLPIGYFGASTGAGAALWAAAEAADRISAVVSRGGRPDLAGPRLAAVTAPTLLIVGGRDDVVLRLNREALAELRCERRLEVVPGATHLFEEPGTLPAAAALARDWFSRHLTGRRTLAG